jgi:hypothetical protein
MNLFSYFFFFGGTKTHWAGRHENKEKRLFYFGHRNILPIQIQLFENPISTPPITETSADMKIVYK